MDIQDKTKEELISELQELLQENNYLKALKEKEEVEFSFANKELLFQNEEKEKRATELNENKTLLASVLDSSLSGIMAFKSIRNAEGAIMDFEWQLVNAAAEQMVSHSQTEILGKRLLEEMPGNRVEGLFDLYVQVVETGIPLNHEHFYEHEKVKTWFHTVAIKRLDGFVVTFSNITERKLAVQELIIANKELLFQNEEKEKRAAELILANNELAFQNEEKEKRAAELILANKELLFQNKEKEKRAAELIIANKELVFQNQEKEKRADELIIANKELAFQNEEKEKRAAELIIANKELVFQNQEKEKRADELIIANKELAFQNEEKEKRAAELIIANKELDFQNNEKGKRAAELIIANKELNLQLNERNKAEKQITRLSNAMDHAADIIFITDREGIIEYLNLAFETITGYSKAEALGNTPRILKSGLMDPQYYKNIWDTILSGKVIRNEAINKNKNGEIFFYDQTITPLIGDDGKVTHFISTGKDTTELNKKEESLRESQELFRKTLELGVVGMTTIHPYTYYFLSANKHLCDMLGYTEAELLQKTWVEITFPKGKIDETIDKLAKLLSGELNGYVMEKQYQHKDGHLIDVTLSAQGVRKKDGTIDYLLVLIEDISIQKKAIEDILNLNASLEIKVEKRTEQLAVTNRSLQEEIEERKQVESELMIQSTALNAAANAIVITHRDGHIEWVNPAFTKLTGYTFEEVKGEKTRILKSGKHDAAFYKNLWNTILAGEVWQDEIINKRKDGSEYTEEMTITPVKAQNGEIIHFIAIKLDITERKIIEEELSKAKAEAEQANLAKSEFLSRMSHELRTPMNSILGFAQLMDMGELNPAHKKGVGHILRSGKHLLNLINEVLDLSRIEAGQLSISVEPVRLNPIISETMDIVQPLAASHDIKLQPESTAECDLFVKADRQKLRQVLLNLISNAVKYNREGGTVKLVCEPGSQKRTVRIRVIDTGPGISPEGIHKLFNAFERIGAEVTEIEGTGLGLTVAKKLIEAMDGTIGVESKPGVGSEFWIELPQSEGQVENYERRDDQTNPEQKIHEVSGRILYIEDNQSNIELMEQIISEYRPSIRLITEMYGKNAVKNAIDYAPDMILLDLNLPDIQGDEVLNLLQQNEKTKSIPVIVLSANAMSGQIEKLMKAGAENYLTKPIDVVEFLKVIDETIGGKA